MVSTRSSRGQSHDSSSNTGGGSNQRRGSNPSRRGGRLSPGRGGGISGTRSRTQFKSRTTNDHNPDSDSSDPDFSGITIDNYERLLPSWTDNQLCEVLARQKGSANQIPPAIKEALQFHKLNYTKIKLMLALIGKVSEKTVNSWM
jgi:hypothetical protein